MPSSVTRRIRQSFVPAAVCLLAGLPVFGDDPPHGNADGNVGILPRWLEARRAEFPDLKWVERVYAAQPFAHSRRISAVAFGPNDESIVTASGEGIHEWSYPQGEELRRIPLDCLNAADHSFSADRARLAVCSDNGDVRLIEWPSGKVLQQVSTSAKFRENHRYINDIALSSDGSKLAIGFRRWSWTKPIGNGRGSANSPSNVTEGGLFVYDLTASEWLAEYEEVGGAVIGVAFDPQGRRLAAGRMDGKILLAALDLTSEKVLAIDVSDPTECPAGLAFTSDGARLAVVTTHGSVSLWNVAEARNLWTHASPRSGQAIVWSGSPGEVVFSADQDRLFARSELLFQLYVFGLEGSPIAYPEPNPFDSCSLALTRAGDTLALSRGPRVRLFDSRTLQPADDRDQQIDRSGLETSDVRASADGRYFVTHTDAAIMLWDLESGHPLRRISPGGKSRFTPDGGHLVVGRNGDYVVGQGRSPGSVTMYDVPAFDVVRTWQLPDGLCEDLELTPEGERVVVCGRREVWVYSLLDGALQGTISPDLNSGTGTDPDWLSGLSISPNGQLAAICVHLRGRVSRQPINDSSRCAIHVHSLKSGERISLIASPGDAHDYEFSHDSRRLIVAGTEAATTVGVPPFPDAVIYDVQSGAELQRLAGDQGSNGVWRLWTDAPRELAFVAQSSVFRAWDTDRGQRLWDLKFPGLIRSIAQVPGGTHILIGRSDGSIWRVRYPDGSH